MIEKFYWRYFLLGWSVFIFSVIIWDFFTNNSLRGIIGPVASIYTAILAIHSVGKEFERWQESLTRQSFGEIYVIIWSMLVVSIFIADAYFKLPYAMPSEIVSTYIGVLGILAITRHSKRIHHQRKKM